MNKGCLLVFIHKDLVDFGFAFDFDIAFRIEVVERSQAAVGSTVTVVDMPVLVGFDFVVNMVVDFHKLVDPFVLAVTVDIGFQ